jgi:hypothetical protein
MNLIIARDYVRLACSYSHNFTIRRLMDSIFDKKSNLIYLERIINKARSFEFKPTALLQSADCDAFNPTASMFCSTAPEARS